MRAKRGTVVHEISQLEDAAAYQRLYRQRRPESAERNRRRSRARSRAALAMARDYPHIFARYLKQELAKEGLEP